MGFLTDHMPDQYKRVSRTLGTTLVLGTADHWHGFSIVISARLKPEERLALAWSVLRALPPEQVIDVANTVRPDHTDPPIPPLFGYMDQAAHWADMAEPEALDAYALASFQAMSNGRKANFLNFIQGRAAA